MEIYLLREEKEVGPYTGEDICTWVGEGEVSAHELAWSPGLETWQPLSTLLDLPDEEAEEFPEPEAVAPEPEPAPVPAPAPRKPVRLVHATPRQKAFLSYMGVFFSPALSEEEAEELSQQAHQDPKLASRLTRWEDERLDLHPELFAAEIQTRRENRPAYFHKLVQTEGGDCFAGVTKAHCQVVVTHLDAHYPRWDARLGDAAWRYFFPAINEKFPQLVRKEWRPKLKYPEGPKMADEMEEIEREKRARAKAQQPFSIRPYVRGLALLLVLGAIGAGVYGYQHPEKVPPQAKAQVELLGARLQALVRGDEQPTAAAKKLTGQTAPAPGAKGTGTSAKVAAGKTEDIPGLPGDDAAPAPEATATKAPAAAPADGMAAAGGMASTTPMAPAADPMASAADMAAMAPADGAAPAAQPKPTESLFNPNANTPAAPATAPAAPGERKEVVLTQPVNIKMAYGLVTINAGTSLKIVARAGDQVQLNYLNKVISVPVTVTDLSAMP